MLCGMKMSATGHGLHVVVCKYLVLCGGRVSDTGDELHVVVSI